MLFGMFDIFDMIHYLIGLLIVIFLIWTLVQIHNYFSKEKVPIPYHNTIPAQNTP